MKSLKNIFEIIVWVILYSPLYLFFRYLDYLAQNVWGVRTEDRFMQLIFPVLIILVLGYILYFFYDWIIYKNVLISYEGRIAKVYRGGVGFLDKLINRRYSTYYYTGITYLTNDKKWIDKNGNTGRILWIDKELRKQKYSELLK